MNVDAFSNPIPSGLNSPPPVATPAPPPPTVTPPAPPTPASPPPAKPTPQKPSANPAQGKPGDKGKQPIKGQQPKKLDTLKDATQQAIKEGLEEGLGDEIAAALKSVLHNVLLAPYDIMNYSLVSFILLSKSGKQKFLTIVTIFALGFSCLWGYFFFTTLDANYLFYIVGALCSCLLILLGMSLDTSTPVKPKKHSKKQKQTAEEFDDIYIE